MIMQSTESYTEEKEKYAPWGWEVTESVKAKIHCAGNFS